MLYVDPPIPLGHTLKGTDPSNSSVLINSERLGQVFLHQASNRTDGLPGTALGRRCGKPVIAVLLRNEAGFALLGKRVALCKSGTAGFGLITAVDGYAAGAVSSPNCVIVDEFLPSAGCADDDIFWGIIGGPVNVLLPLVGADMAGGFAVGDPVVASTGTTTGATTSGRVGNVSFTAATAGNTSNGFDGFRMARNLLGTALSAATSQQTTAGQQLLIDARIQW